MIAAFVLKGFFKCPYIPSMPGKEWSLGASRQPNSMPEVNYSYPEIEDKMTYIEMYVISLFNVQVLEIVIAVPQTSDVRSKSRRLFLKAEHSLDVTSSLALGQRPP